MPNGDRRMMTVVRYWAALAATCGLIAVTAYAHHKGDQAGYQRGHAEQIETINHQLTENNEALAATVSLLMSERDWLVAALDDRARRLEQQGTAHRAAQENVAHALDEHSPWRDMPVPVGIADRLCTDADRHPDSSHTAPGIAR